MKNPFRKVFVSWIGWGGDLFFWNIWRLNSGYPYQSWRIGPVLIKRYL